MGIVKTSIYGIEAPDDLDPITNGAVIMRRNAATIEAALVRGGIAPPAAQDLATLAGRVTALETTGGIPVAPFYPALNGTYWQDFAGWHRVMLWAERYTVHVAGVFQAKAAVPAGEIPLFTIARADLRPAKGAVGAAIMTWGSVPGNASPTRLDVESAGGNLEVVTNGVPVGSFGHLNASWPRI